MAYYPKARGGGNTYHDHWSETPYGSNSPNGPHLAKKHSKGWIDIDATRTHDDVLINDHGKPVRAYFHGHERSTQVPWAKARNRAYVHNGHVYHLRTIAAAMVANAATFVHGRHLGSEVEIKNLAPISTTRLHAIMAQLAHDAHVAYGPRWKERMLVKVLTDYAGGVDYALRVCEAAHAAGIPTMLLVRGRARFRRFKGHTEVTYVRGSAVIR